jgi:hypothetical protein
MMKMGKINQNSKRCPSRSRKKNLTTKNTRPRKRAKSSFIDVDTTLSPHSAFIAVFVMQNGEPIKLLNFETNLGVITGTIDLVTSGRYFRHDPRPNAHTELVRIIMDDNAPKDDLNTIIINFICYYEAEVALEAFPNQSIGCFLYLDVDDLSRCHLEGGLFADMVEWYSKIIGFSLEDSAA